MGDNTVLNPGVGGDTILTDDLGTAKAPVSKLMLGADGVDGGLVTTSNPLPTSVQGSVAVTGAFYQATQPVSGPLTDAQLRAVAVPVSGTVNATCSGTVAVTGTFWQATQPVSGPLTDAELRAVAVPVSGTFWQATQPISAAALPLPADAATQTTLAALNTKVTACNTGAVVVSSGSITATQGTAANLLCTASQGGTWTVQPGNTANTTPWLVKEYRSATGTTTTVSGSASTVTLLASNANRLGAIIANDSTAILYVKLGSTASTTSYAYKLYTDDTVEIPYGYTGVIDGIWASATGNARITELT